MDESDPKKPKATAVVMEGTLRFQDLGTGKRLFREKQQRDETQVIFCLGFPFLACVRAARPCSKIDCFRLQFIFAHTTGECQTHDQCHEEIQKVRIKLPKYLIRKAHS